MLTPIDEAILQCDTVYQLAGVRTNRLGDYGRFYFRDRALRRPLGAFRAALDDIEAGAPGRSRGRVLPYPYLLPSEITASTRI